MTDKWFTISEKRMDEEWAETKQFDGCTEFEGVLSHCKIKRAFLTDMPERFIIPPPKGKPRTIWTHLQDLKMFWEAKDFVDGTSGISIFVKTCFFFGISPKRNCLAWKLKFQLQQHITLGNQSHQVARNKSSEAKLLVNLPLDVFPRNIIIHSATSKEKWSFIILIIRSTAIWYIINASVTTARKPLCETDGVYSNKSVQQRPKNPLCGSSWPELIPLSVATGSIFIPPWKGC